MEGIPAGFLESHNKTEDDYKTYLRSNDLRCPDQLAELNDNCMVCMTKFLHFVEWLTEDDHVADPIGVSHVLAKIARFQQELEISMTSVSDG